ncbi:MAG: ABC-2 transporter permease [Peptoniphilus harei]|uniref:ABC-2 transporter permease n=1 Tax=Peptoniphilus harei TaxID=54005 RepID=UPI002900BCD3|nr:ABC-2 transporter permease [Peptoniphilus harei]MDU3086880.1 ABC-2 transporter permease [Peptoniphilus harei]
MKDIKKIVNLDYISIKPYFTLKNLIIMIFLYLVYFFVTSNPLTANSAILIFSIVYSSYPFLIGEEAGIDSLYRIFGIKSEKVVLGRYVFALVLFIFALLISIVFSIIFSFFVETADIREFLATSLAYLLVYLIFISLKYPLYFKFGYKKAKSISALTFVLIGLLSFLVMALKDSLNDLFIFMENNIFITLLISLLLVLAIVIISIKSSQKFYKNRDF